MNTVFFNALRFQSELGNAFRDMILARELGSQRSTISSYKQLLRNYARLGRAARPY